MSMLIGTLLALAVCAMTRLAGLDRDRALYPVILIVIASYYCLFAVMAGSSTALWSDAGIALLFTVAAIIGFRRSPWLIAAALAAHGVMDLFHHQLVANAGVPPWWPGFCSAFDITAAIWFGISLAMDCRSARLAPASAGE
ncbi:hypothetical protein [Sandarakinorhabdus rubra]|uniref:hypothetical protein n=1 Tax=Sandarakinorhabdus rubra TaxID=2672568 RepID=UPI0013D94F99|nr:hypothetical protein [Sandarakinorhabdus rubra]